MNEAGVGAQCPARSYRGTASDETAGQNKPNKNKTAKQKHKTKNKKGISRHFSIFRQVGAFKTF